MIVHDLCYKQIVDIIPCARFCFARNNEKIIYYWDEINRRVYQYTSDENIIDMKSGEFHSIFLNQKGEVYHFSCPIHGPLEGFELQFFKVNGFDSETVVMISCGFNHCLALTESGRVFGWGNNISGQLGINIKRSSDPVMIELYDIKIKKINCGFGHSLLLSCDGNIYAFGENSCGEVGNGDREPQILPIKLKKEKKFNDIASHPYFRISMSLSDENKFYVWGDCGQYSKPKHILTMKETKFKSFEEILNFYYKIYFKPEEKLLEFEDPFFRNGFFTENFEEIEELGSGSYGRVYQAKAKNFDKYVAVKKLVLNTKHKKEFMREFNNFHLIHELNYQENDLLVTNFDAWFEVSNITNMFLYIQMELCDRTLEDLIEDLNEEQFFKANEMLTEIGFYIFSQIFIEILESVDYLHKQNPPIMHRDLHSENILLKNQSNLNNTRFVKIADFGLSKAFKQFTNTCDIGRPKYTAPENVSSEEYDTKTDIFSLGKVFEYLFDLDIDPM
jgi:tRNA A-37 threonylcarbamoyl transferase component Bud32